MPNLVTECDAIEEPMPAYASMIVGSRMAFPLDVLEVVGEAMLFQLLSPEDVLPLDGVASVPHRDDQGFVHHVLDTGSGRVRRDDSQLLDLVGSQAVLDLGQVVLVRLSP